MDTQNKGFKSGHFSSAKIDPHFIISIFHILVVVPFFFYIFYNRSATPDYIYNILFFVGLFVLVYHIYKSAIKISSGSKSLWVNLIHVLVIAPIMIYIGYEAKKTPRAAYELLGLVTFAALGYHVYNTIMMLNVNHED